MISIPRRWDENIEQRVSNFGSAYTGFYIDVGKIRYVGYVGVVKDKRGRGRFKAILEAFKEGMDAVVLYSPTFLTRRLAERYGYYFDSCQNVIIWERKEMELFE